MTKCEICEKEFPSCDTHHIVSKSKGGKNNIFNTTLLCPNCHRRVHISEIILEGKFLTTNDGYKLIWRKGSDESITQVKDPEVFIFKEK